METEIVTTAVMILRVWVMYSRSRLILGTLLALLLIEIITLILAASIYSNPKYVPGRLHSPTIDTAARVHLPQRSLSAYRMSHTAKCSLVQLFGHT